MNKVALLQTAALLSNASEPEGTTLFSKLSQEAQDIIVNATLGAYEDGPPEMSDEVREEIRLWAITEEHPEDEGTTDSK